jgi:hypothetical protein
METEKLNELVKNNPNKLYSLLASGREAQRSRFGKFGKQLYVPHNEFIAEKVFGDIEKEARQNIHKQDTEAKKKRKDSF